MKKLFLYVSLLGISGLQSTAAPTAKRRRVEDQSQVVKVISSDGITLNLPINHTFTTIYNVVGDLGNDQDSPALPLPIDSYHLHHAIELQTNPHYVLPVTYEELRGQSVTHQGLLKVLNYLDAQDFMNSFYTSWLNNPKNENAAVHHNVSASIILNQMGLDSKDLPLNVTYAKISLKRDHTRTINNYVHRMHANVSIQNLLDTNQVPLYDENDEDTYTCNLQDKNIVSLDGIENIPDKDQFLELDFDNNKLTTLNSGVFSGFTSLQNISFENNKITTLEPGAFQGLSNVRELNLNNNHLTILNRNVLNDLTSLRYLRCSNNQLKILEVEVFNNLRSLRLLSLRNNKLKKFSFGVFKKLPALEQVYLQGNPISKEQREQIREELAQDVSIMF